MVILAPSSYLVKVFIYMSMNEKQLNANRANILVLFMSKADQGMAVSSVMATLLIRRRTKRNILKIEETNPNRQILLYPSIYSPATNKAKVIMFLVILARASATAGSCCTSTFKASGLVSANAEVRSRRNGKTPAQNRVDTSVDPCKGQIDIYPAAGRLWDKRSRYNWPISAPRMKMMEE
jgi:hypothetical protein